MPQPLPTPPAQAMQPARVMQPELAREQGPEPVKALALEWAKEMARDREKEPVRARVLGWGRPWIPDRATRRDSR
jgi:hypothetical protein